MCVGVRGLKLQCVGIFFFGESDRRVTDADIDTDKVVDTDTDTGTPMTKNFKTKFEIGQSQIGGDWARGTGIFGFTTLGKQIKPCPISKTIVHIMSHYNVCTFYRVSYNSSTTYPSQPTYTFNELTEFRKPEKNEGSAKRARAAVEAKTTILRLYLACGHGHRSEDKYPLRSLALAKQPLSLSRPITQHQLAPCPNASRTDSGRPRSLFALTSVRLVCTKCTDS